MMAGCGDDASSPATGQTNTTGGTSAEGGAAGSGTSGQAGTNPNACTPGKLDPCPCVGTSTTGVQTCQADGTFSACQGCPTGAGGSGGTGATGGAGGTSSVGGSGGSAGSAGSNSEGGSAGAAGSGAGGSAGTAGSAGIGGAGGSNSSSASATSLAAALGTGAKCEACLQGMTGNNINGSDCTEVLTGCDADEVSIANPTNCADAIAKLQEIRTLAPKVTPDCWVEIASTFSPNKAAEEVLLCAAKTEADGGCATACGGNPEAFSPGFICEEAPPMGCYQPVIAQPMAKCDDPGASECVKAICADPECKPKWEACESDPKCNAGIDCFAQCTAQGAGFSDAFGACQPIIGTSLSKATPITSCREKQPACN